MTMFLDGTGITPGSEKCQCSEECEFPCWQRIGIASACVACGCDAIKPHADIMREMLLGEEDV